MHGLETIIQMNEAAAERLRLTNEYRAKRMEALLRNIVAAWNDLEAARDRMFEPIQEAKALLALLEGASLERQS